MDLPSQPLAPNVAPQSVVGPPPPKKVSLAGKIIPVIIILVLVIAGFFAARFFLQLSKKSQKVELAYWGLWESESIIKPLIDEYQTAHPNVKISYVFQSPREYRERLQTALSMSKGPDLFRIHNSWIPMFKNDLSPVPPTAYSASEFESTFYPTVKSDLRLSGNYMAIPLEIDGLAMFINDDLLTKSGQSIPASWEDLRSAAKALSVCDSEDGTCSTGDRILISGAAMGTTDNVDHWQDILAVLMLQNNVNLNAPTGASAEDALSYYSVFTRSDHVWDSTLPPSTQAFAAGKLAIYFAPSWRVFDLNAINPQLKFSVHPIPQLPLDPARGEKPVTWASYWVEGVNKKSPNTTAAWEFLKFLSSKESLAKLYQQAVISGRPFGEPYSRIDLASQLSSDPLAGPYIAQAQYARSWYIASDTFDGPTGINTRLSAHFATAVGSVNQGRSPSEAVKTLSAGINQVLSQYGLASPITP
ncbi:MAG: extracellular solute-binding protein [Patescibacteria group bacterium]